MDQNTHSLYADRVLPIEQLSNMRFAYAVDIIPAAQKVKNHIITFTEAKSNVQKAQKVIDANWHAYKLTYLTPEEALLVKQTDAIKNQADENANELIAILSKQDIQALNKFIDKTYSAATDPFFKKLTALMDLQVRVGKELFHANNEIYHTTTKRFFIIILIALVTALSLSFFLIRSIRRMISNILKSNDSIKESEEKYHSLFEQASDAIYVLNYKGEFTQVNDSMCKMVGYTRDELLTMNVTELLNADILDAYPLLYSKIKPGQSSKGERKFIKKDGTMFDIDIKLKKFTDDRILVIARDITARKKMEAELRTAELKFRTLADKSKVGIYILQKGKFVYLNPRFAEIFGYNIDELINVDDPAKKIVHPDYYETVVDNLRARFAGGIEYVHYEVMGLKKDGSTNWIELYGSRIEMEGEPTIIGSMIDVTERKSAEDDLKTSEQKYKLLFESNPVPLWIVAKDDLTVITANDAAAKLYGYSQDELQNMEVRKLRPAQDWEKQLKSYQKDIANATDFGVITHLKKDGTPILVNIISQDILFNQRHARLSSTNDVTEKIKAEELLKATEANLQTILNNTDTAYALLNAELEILEYNNKALIFAKNEFNFEPDSGGKIFDSMPDDRRFTFLGYISDVFKGNTISYEVAYSQPDGIDLWYYVRMSPISDKKDEILGLVLAITDITERKEAEQSLQTAYDQIKTNIQFIREMVWKQSHILRSPVANLKGLIPILGMDPSDKEVMGYIEAELERIDAVFHEMATDSSRDEMNY